MISSLLQLLFSSFFVIGIGLINSKLIAINLNADFVGYFGFIKSNATFISSLILIGLNYSFYFIEKDRFDIHRDKAKSIRYTFKYSILTCNISFLIFFVPFFIYFLVKGDSGSLLLMLSVLCAGVITTSSLFCKRDASNSKFSNFWLYNSIAGIFYLLIILIYIFLDFSFFLIILLFFFAFIFSAFGFLIYFKELNKKEFVEFFFSNVSYSKLFQLNLILSTGFLALVQHFLINDLKILTEFNVIMTLVSLLNIISTVLGNYLFPRLVANSNNKEYLMLYKYTYFILFIFSSIFVYFFDFFVSLLFKKEFITFSVSVVFFAQAKVFEIMTGIIGYKYSSTMNFTVIYTGFFLFSFPLVIYFFCAYFMNFKIDILFISMSFMLGWLVRFIYYLFLSEETISNKFLFTLLLLVFSFLQVNLFNYDSSFNFI